MAGSPRVLPGAEANLCEASAKPQIVARAFSLRWFQQAFGWLQAELVGNLKGRRDRRKLKARSTTCWFAEG
jgi:hypothetical protein